MTNKQLIVSFRINGAVQDQHMSEWYFGTEFVRKMVRKIRRGFWNSGIMEMTAFKNGVGYLTISIR